MTDPNQTPAVQIDVEKRVGQFVTLRDFKAELAAKHAAEMAPINETMQMIKDELLQALNASSAQNMKTAAGTVMVTQKATASAADPAAFWTWVITQAEFDMVDKKPNVTAVTEYVTKHGHAPPGVNYSVFVDVGVRRK